MRDIVVRQLDIGASKRISGFETLNAVRGRNIDHVADARNLPFRDNTFATIYASHVLEHIPWIETQRAVDEWVRCLAHGGRLEVWVPDALRVARAFVEAEDNAASYGCRRPVEAIITDPLWHANAEHDPCVWFASRTFTWHHRRMGEYSWHRAAFTPRYLCLVLERAGLTNVRIMDISEMRLPAHLWVSLGACGVKP